MTKIELVAVNAAQNKARTRRAVRLETKRRLRPSRPARFSNNLYAQTANRFTATHTSKCEPAILSFDDQHAAAISRRHSHLAGNPYGVAYCLDPSTIKRESKRSVMDGIQRNIHTNLCKCVTGARCGFCNLGFMKHKNGKITLGLSPALFTAVIAAAHTLGIAPSIAVADDPQGQTNRDWGIIEVPTAAPLYGKG